MSGHPYVAECAVVGAADPLKGELPVGFIVPSDGSRNTAELPAALVEKVRTDLGALACFRHDTGSESR
eukprot:gene11966-3661_t